MHKVDEVYYFDERHIQQNIRVRCIVHLNEYVSHECVGALCVHGGSVET